jgi:hypothetical protein
MPAAENRGGRRAPNGRGCFVTLAAFWSAKLASDPTQLGEKIARQRNYDCYELF